MSEWAKNFVRFHKILNQTDAENFLDKQKSFIPKIDIKLAKEDLTIQDLLVLAKSLIRPG